MAYSYGEVDAYIEKNKCKLLTPRYKYINIKQNLLIQCWRCGDVFEQSFRGFLNSKHKTCRGCRYVLAGQKKAKTTEEYEQEVFILESGEYSVIGEYVNARSKVEMRHNTCGHEWGIEPNIFLVNGNRCPNCSPKKRRTYEEFCQEVYSLVGDEYKVLGGYKNSTTKVELLHRKCGNVWNTTPANLITTGSRCPYCYRSKGEEKVALYLDGNSIEYEEQYLFDNCRNINPLPFDFYLPRYNILIEYDGVQHFEPCGFGEKDEKEIMKKFKTIQKRDKIKNIYCKDNNIKLLRIPYYDFDKIEETLDDLFKDVEEIAYNI